LLVYKKGEREHAYQATFKSCIWTAFPLTTRHQFGTHSLTALARKLIPLLEHSCNHTIPHGRVLLCNSHSASQEIPRLLWNPEFHFRLHNSLPLDPNLSQMNPVHTLFL